MRILLDENLPRKLAGYLTGHKCRTVVECGWSGKKNGELLAEALSTKTGRRVEVSVPQPPLARSPRF